MKKALFITLLAFFAIFTNQNANAQTQSIIVDFSQIEFNDNSSLSIYTIDGKLKDKIEVHKSIGFKVLDTRYWKSGIYVVSLQQKKGKAFSNTVIVNH